MPGIPDEVANELYAQPPERFLARRGELAGRARDAGDAATAQLVERARKPTVAAWIVNAYVIAEPAAVERLVELGARLRAAQEALDAAALRDLSTERRGLVGELVQGAFSLAGRSQPAATLRDEVTGTFDAALADPEIAGRLGRLQRAERWSGFGFATTSAPALTLVQGGQGGPAPGGRAVTAESAGPAPRETVQQRRASAAATRQRERELSRAQDALTAAEADHEQARQAEESLVQQVRGLTKRLATLQGQLDATRGELEQARRATVEARRRRREARSALDRVERAID